MITRADLNLFTQYKHLENLTKKHKTFIAFDTETTGTNSKTDCILEIGAYKISFDRNSPYYENPQIFDMLINPEIEIPAFISQLTGITNEMISGAENTKNVIKEFLKFIGEDSVLIAHNAPFDLYFIDNQLEKMYIKPIKNLCVDTLPLSRWAFPEFASESQKGNYTLQNLAKKLNIQVNAAHRAYDDAKVCMELFKKIYFSHAEPLPDQLELIFETP